MKRLSIIGMMLFLVAHLGAALCFAQFLVDPAILAESLASDMLSDGINTKSAYETGFDYETKGLYSKAYYYYKLAADSDEPGYGMAPVRKVASYLYYGIGVEKNDDILHPYASDYANRIADKTWAMMSLHVSDSIKMKGETYYFNAEEKWLEMMQKTADKHFWSGNLYYTPNKAFKKNHDQAVYWWKMGADKKEIKSMSALGALYMDADYPQKNYATAADWLKKATKKGDANAYFNLGLLYAYGYIGKGVDMKQAEKNWNSAAKANPAIVLRIAEEYGKSSNSFYDPQKQEAWREKLLSLKDNDICNDSGLKHLSTEKLDCYIKKTAMLYEYGLKYLTGDGVKQDKKKGVKFLEEYCERKLKYTTAILSSFDYLYYDTFLGYDSSAVLDLESNPYVQIGDMFFSGTNGVSKDTSVAMDWYQRAVKDTKSGLAQYKIAEMHEYGIGVKLDVKRARYLYELSADLGCRDAYYKLGNFYLTGNTVKQNEATGIAWLSKIQHENEAAKDLIYNTYKSLDLSRALILDTVDSTYSRFKILDISQAVDEKLPYQILVNKLAVVTLHRDSKITEQLLNSRGDYDLRSVIAYAEGVNADIVVMPRIVYNQVTTGEIRAAGAQTGGQSSGAQVLSLSLNIGINVEIYDMHEQKLLTSLTTIRQRNLKDYLISSQSFSTSKSAGSIGKNFVSADSRIQPILDEIIGDMVNKFKHHATGELISECKLYNKDKILDNNRLVVEKGADFGITENTTAKLVLRDKSGVMTDIANLTLEQITEDKTLLVISNLKSGKYSIKDLRVVFTLENVWPMSSRQVKK